VLSTHIDAEARRLVALGDFLESAAIARRINIEADREAMRNSVIWVETYFERRKLNMQYRNDLRTDYAESELKITSATHRRIIQGGSLGGVTDEINFMMNRLNADATAYREIFLSDGPVIDSVDLSLSPNTVTHILLREKGRSAGGRTFRPADPQVVDAGWPKVFLRPEFDTARDKYDAARRQAIKEIEAGDLSIPTLESLQAALRQLEKAFEGFYVWKDRKDTIDIATFTSFRQMGENFLRTQAAGSLRAFAMGDADAFAKDLEFDGDSLVDLMRHCSQKNLEFAQPNPGDEATYGRVYQQIRQMYVEFFPESHSFN
jgi:hypothetical protein